MSRDELEALIRQQITRVLTVSAGTSYTSRTNDAVDAILAGADSYLARTRPSPAASLPVIHWEKPGATFRAACTGRLSGPVTADTGNVTCGSCRESGIWRKTFQEATR